MIRQGQPRFFHTIAVEQIDVAAGVALLRARGAHGTDVQLAPIVEHCGRHALTIDLAGGNEPVWGYADGQVSIAMCDSSDLIRKWYDLATGQETMITHWAEIEVPEGP